MNAHICDVWREKFAIHTADWMYDGIGYKKPNYIYENDQHRKSKLKIDIHHYIHAHVREFKGIYEKFSSVHPTSLLLNTNPHHNRKKGFQLIELYSKEIKLLIILILHIFLILPPFIIELFLSLMTN